MWQFFKNRLLWLRNSGVTQTFIGFLSFLIIAAVIMLFLESPESESGIKNLFTSLWFSIVTVTTVGYGDISPISALGKAAAVVIMFIGILYIGVLTGNITSWLVERNRRRVQGLVPISKKEGHFLILGWRPGMASLLKDILDLHKRDSSYLVLVNNANTKDVNDLKQDPLLKDISFFSGDYTNKEVLKNACGLTASKVLVLSDRAPGLTVDEIDFKSVLATIAIKRLNPQIYAIVEIVQPKFSLYLQHVEVEEIILNRSRSRALLSNIALMSGLNNVFTSFFSMNDGLLKIIPIENEYIGNTYEEFKSKFKKYFILGIVENGGNIRKIKNSQMNEVFKSISIQKAIQAVNELKSIKSNVPFFHPPPNYIVKKNSQMIVLTVEGRDFSLSELSSETIAETRSVLASDEEYLKHQIISGLSKTKNWNDLVAFMQLSSIEFYQYNNQINGVIHHNTKFPFVALGLESDKCENINQRFEKKSDKKSQVRLKINEFLKSSLDWDEFFDRLRREGMTFYHYRKAINGIQYEDKNYSFKSLAIPDEIADEIRKLKSSKQDPKSSKKHSLSVIEHQSLSSIINELRSKSSILKKEKGEKEKVLIICGWKPQLPEMLSFILSQHVQHEKEWNRISVIAKVDDQTAQQFEERFDTQSSVNLFQGSMVDRDLLKKAGIVKATKVILLAETEQGKSNEEIDSQTVLAAMMIGSLNKNAYKIAEILDKRYRESLEQANVEEIYLDDEFTRILLANGSHGLGVTKVIGELINFNSTLLKTKSIEQNYINESFGRLVREKSYPGELIIGLLEETGNKNVRKSERIHQAQIQSNIRGQVEELIKVKEFEPNRVVIAPSIEYIVQPHSKLISLTSSNLEGWRHYQDLS